MENGSVHHSCTTTPTTGEGTTMAGDAPSRTMDLTEEELEQRRRQLEFRAVRRTQRLRALGLDDNGEPLDNYSLDKYPVREIVISLPGLQDPVALNPVVTLIGVVCSWSVVLWILVDSDRALETIVTLRTFVSLHCTWVFQGSKSILFFFMMFTTYRYGHIHMGDPTRDQPEYSMLVYVTMIFCAGIGVGLLVFVTESLFHQRDNFYAQAGYQSSDDKDMFAVNMTATNWCITGWIHYTVVAVCMSLAGHRFSLPILFRSCFYPILGPYTWGWMGDCIDGIAIFVTMIGVCTNLSLGTLQIVSSLVYMGLVDDHATRDHINSIHNATLWVVTIVSTASMLSGLGGGIRFLSCVAASLATLLLLLVFVMDDTKFLLNLVVQEVGYFMQTSIFLLNFWTDAFGQLRDGSGRAVDGKAADQNWMDMWMTFYQAWVITWAAFIGVFVALISKGRKLWEIVLCTFLFPLSYSLVWFTVWSGISLRQTRQATELAVLGLTHFNNSQHFSVDGCYDVPQEDVIVDGTVVFTNHLVGVTPVCQFDETKASKAAFHLLYSFRFPESFGKSGLGPCLLVLFVLCSALYFVTSADSSTLIVDRLASNGRKNRHWARRTFWAITIGALATALLSSGEINALYAVQSASVVCGLPVAVLMCYLIQSITLLCQAAERHDYGTDYLFPNQPEFPIPVYGGIFNLIEYAASFGTHNKVRVALGIVETSRLQVAEFVKGILVPFVSLGQILHATYPQNPLTNMVVVTAYMVCYFGWISLFCYSHSRRGLSGLAWVVFCLAGATLTVIRSGFRSLYNIRSNIIGDMVASIFFWPQVLTQMRLHCDATGTSATTASNRPTEAPNH